jgi:hypothetical protein
MSPSKELFTIGKLVLKGIIFKNYLSTMIGNAILIKRKASIKQNFETYHS